MNTTGPITLCPSKLTGAHKQTIKTDQLRKHSPEFPEESRTWAPGVCSQAVKGLFMWLAAPPSGSRAVIVGRSKYFPTKMQIHVWLTWQGPYKIEYVLFLDSIAVETCDWLSGHSCLFRFSKISLVISAVFLEWRQHFFSLLHLSCVLFALLRLTDRLCCTGTFIFLFSRYNLPVCWTEDSIIGDSSFALSCMFEKPVPRDTSESLPRFNSFL